MWASNTATLAGAWGRACQQRALLTQERMAGGVEPHAEQRLKHLRPASALGAIRSPVNKLLGDTGSSSEPYRAGLPLTGSRVSGLEALVWPGGPGATLRHCVLGGLSASVVSWGLPLARGPERASCTLRLRSAVRVDSTGVRFLSALCSPCSVCFLAKRSQVG